MKIAQAKEAKDAIKDEIDRLSRDLYSEAEKLVAEEVLEKEGLKADQAHIEDEFKRLKSRLMLEKDRYEVAASLVRETKRSLEANSVDSELLPVISVDLEDRSDTDVEEFKEAKKERKQSAF